MATETTNDRQRMLGLQFSVMLPEHLDQVMDIELRSFPIPWSYSAFLFELAENDFAFYIVALVKGKVAGYAGMWIVLDEAHITNVAVHPGYRGRGIGRELMMELLSRAAVLGAVKVTLEVRVSNQVARNLYESLGFENRGLRRKYYSDNNEDAVIMWLDFRQWRREPGSKN
ncbi:MAG: ribosomal protein S18-alanine N-acetyltransferase [Bacillota bacterium]